MSATRHCDIITKPNSKPHDLFLSDSPQFLEALRNISLRLDSDTSQAAGRGGATVR